MFENPEIPFIISSISLVILLLVDRYANDQIKILTMILFLTESSVLSFFFDKYPTIFSLPVLFLSLFLVIKNFHILNIQKSDSNKLFCYIYNNYSITKGIALLLISFVIIYEIFADFYFSQSDFLIFTLSLILFFYDDFSTEYNKEIDIILIFFSVLVIFEIIPFVLYKFLYGGIGSSSDTWFDNEPLVNFLLAKPLSNILNLLGYTSHSDGLLVFFENNHSGLYQGVSIAESCSGIISIQVFISFLVAYLYVQENLSLEINIFIILSGIVISYFANLFRMTIIVLTGHYYGTDALQFVHQYLGWLIFTIWIFLFYFLISKLFSRRFKLLQSL